MITFPPCFVATRIPGYYWDFEAQKLFSIKTGTLKEIKYFGGTTYRVRGVQYCKPESYRVSNKGKRVFLSLEYLKRLKSYDQVVPVERTLVLEQDLKIGATTFAKGTKVTFVVG